MKIFPFIQARYCQERGIDANRASMMYLYNGVASLILRLLTGYLCDNNKIHPKFILQAGLFLAGVTCALITLRPSYVHLLVCFIVYGAADGAVVSSMNILALSTLPPHQRTQGFAFWHFCISFSLITGPPFGGAFHFCLHVFASALPRFLSFSFLIKAVPSPYSVGTEYPPQYPPGFFHARSSKH